MKGLSLPSFNMSTISVLKLFHKVFLFSSLFTNLPTLDIKSCMMKIIYIYFWGPGSGVLASWGLGVQRIEHAKIVVEPLRNS